jgi:heme-degrading monooxygenase HmoA
MQNDTSSENVELSSVIVPSAQAEEYENELRTQLVPNYERAAGLISLHVLRRPLSNAFVEIVIVSIWQTGQALREFVSYRSISECSANGIIRLGARTYEVMDV